MIDMIAAKRRSIRRFTGESIDEMMIRELLVTAGRAPSGKNRQPWYFRVIGQKVWVKTAIKPVKYWGYSGFIFLGRR